MLSKLSKLGLRSARHAVAAATRAGCSGGARRGFYDEATVSGANALYLESLYTQWKIDPSRMDPKWTEYFSALETGKQTAVPAAGTAMRSAAMAEKLTTIAPAVSTQAAGSVALNNLLRAYQVRGHEAANLDPLNLHQWRVRTTSAPELDPSYHGFADSDMDKPMEVAFAGLPAGSTLRDLLAAAKRTYCSSVGFEYMHMGDAEKLKWLQTRIETSAFIPTAKDDLKRIYTAHCWADTFEQFLNKKYKTTKRFGVDGAEATIAGVNACIEKAAAMGVSECVIGMPHRGRLNILTNVVSKPLVQMFAEFKGTHYDFDALLKDSESDDYLFAGDVKYHLGTTQTRTLPNGKTVQMTLEANPSHLETVNGVTLGRTRAKQFFLGNTDETRSRVLPIIFHGDASFAGQGVVYETMQLAHVQEFDVGGTIHVIVNNQVGFTTDPIDDRSTQYASDLGKGFNMPIFHVNADDTAAVAATFELAAEWRQTWHTDVIVDVIGYRRFGHNEMDAPEYTQPLLYKKITPHPRSEEVFRKSLISQGIPEAELEAIKTKIWDQHEEAFKASDTWNGQESWVATKWEGFAAGKDKGKADPTAVPFDLLTKIGLRLTEVPEGFTPHKGLARQLKKKRQDIESGENIDWGTAEALAFGSLLLEGTHVRITGQDVQRGTFSHRHCVIKDQNNGSDYCFLNNLNLGPQQHFTARNSILAEYGVLGFELGYSYENPRALCIWEAQFGDFANTAQVMIDQFVCAGEHKWLQQSGLVMLLPHGYQGQGAEHSSCRLERYLQLCDDDEDDILETPEDQYGRAQCKKANWQVMNISTPANYFHALRRQQHRDFRKPLVCASPKNLLKLKACTSKLSDMAENRWFQRILPERDPEIANNPDKVDRLVFCTGKIYYELIEERDKQGLKNVAIVTIEQIAPFPSDRIEKELKKYPNVDLGDGVHPGNVVWCQEEPKNMGAWFYVRPRVVTVARERLEKDLVVRYVGRRAAAAPATGYPKLHSAEQESLVQEALLGHDDGNWQVQRANPLLGYQT